MIKNFLILIVCIYNIQYIHIQYFSKVVHNNSLPLIVEFIIEVYLVETAEFEILFKNK